MGQKLFWLAVLIWALATFPCVHLRNVYGRHHLLSAGAHPELFSAYLWRAIWITAGASLLAPVLLWAVPKKLKSEESAVFLWGTAISLLLTFGMWLILAPAFRWLSERPLDPANFLYSGVVAGVVVAEVHRRALLAESGVVRSALELKRDFSLAALMTWAVLLKVLDCIYLTTIQPGKVVVGIHFFMFLSVLLWTPWVCKFFWKYQPSSQMSSIIRSCAAGVLLPPLVGLVLLIPVTILLYTGITATYAMLWGLAFYSVSGHWGPLVFFSPGLTWGSITGLLRWRYLQMERQLPLPPPVTNLPTKQP